MTIGDDGRCVLLLGESAGHQRDVSLTACAVPCWVLPGLTRGRSDCGGLQRASGQGDDGHDAAGRVESDHAVVYRGVQHVRLGAGNGQRRELAAGIAAVRAGGPGRGVVSRHEVQRAQGRGDASLGRLRRAGGGVWSCAAVAISASEARSRLFPLLQQVNDDHVPVRINSKSGDVVLMSAEDFDSWQETIYLLRSPANARRLMEAVARDKSGQAAVVKTMEELNALAGE
jgi:antitoxin YefM